MLEEILQNFSPLSGRVTEIQPFEGEGGRESSRAT